MSYAVVRRELAPDPHTSQTVRTISRLAQALLDLRMEYERKPLPETVAQIDRRLGELLALRAELRARQ